MYLLILNTLLVFAWARSGLVHMRSWHSHVNSPCYAPNTSHGSPCNTCTVTLGIWVMNVPTMLLHLIHLALSLASTLPPAGFVITLTHLPVVMAVTTSARFKIELQKQRRYLKMGVSAVCTIGFFVSLTYTFVSSEILLSAFFFPRIHNALQDKQWKAQLRLFPPRRALVKFFHTTCGIFSWSCSFSSRLARKCTLRRRRRLGQNCTLLSFCP